MQRFLSIALALCMGLTLSIDAEARRFGGGKSFGNAPSHQSAPQRRAESPQAAPNRQAGAPQSGASRWLGPLAGIAAGGLLASMFMGDGFEGLQLFDFLIFGVIAFVIYRLIAARRRNAAAGQPAMAGGAPWQQRQAAESAPMFGGGGAAPAPVINAPSWFNEASFVEAGRQHFLALQQHWDANEMDKIAEFVTPPMLDFLTRERADLGDAYQSTYVDELQVQLDGVDDQADKTIATLTFSGVAKTSRFDQGEPFSESWRLERAQGDNQPWLVAGIRQN